MAYVPAITGAPRGIAHTLNGYVVQNENITENPIREQVADQDGAIAAEIKYDVRYDLRLTLIGATPNATAPAAGDSFSYANQSWVVDNVEEAGTYSTLRRWNVTAHRYSKPAASTVTWGGAGA